MQQFADLSPFSNQPAHARETSQQFDVLDHGTAECKAASASSSAMWPMIAARSLSAF
jgi:hypothetical protein